MVCTANDLQGWKDFPKGLRVLLLEGDNNSASEIRTKLESMDYNVSIFYNVNEALSGISSSPKGFHVAVVEVSTSCPDGGFKFLENAKDLPTIMTSNIHCLNTMMKCIALGAVEFLTKPLSEDKLKNIWQHVVHKAFNADKSAMSEPQKPVKESVESMSIDLDKVSKFSDNEQEHSAASDKYPAPSTPQLKQVARLVDDGDCHEQTKCSIEKESGEHDGSECKFVETSCENLNTENSLQPTKPLIKEEEDSSKGESGVSTNPQSKNLLDNADGNASPNERSGPKDSCENRANRKKMKVDWTSDLHKKFVKAVEQLGIDQAIPSRILELMKVDGLTRHNVASHLQKYRMHKRQMLHADEDRKWPNQRDPMQRNYCMQRPIMAYPPYHSNHTYPPAPIYPMWGQPGSQIAGVPIWAPPPPGYPLWQQPTENWHWKPYPPGVHVDAWGNPMLPPQTPCFPYTQNIIGLQNAKATDYRFGMPHNSFEHYPAEEVVDKVVKEAINKPWLPLPIGLKPPSMDSVMAELTKEGIPFSKGKGSKSKPC
ncbi:hypothetical protein RYX36_003412 [Vicia faba]